MARESEFYLTQLGDNSRRYKKCKMNKHNMKSSKITIKTPTAPPPQPAPKKKDEGVHDLEQHFLLRLPPGPSMALRRDIQSAAMNLKDRLSIEIGPDGRHGKVTYGGYVFNAKMMDLPCVIETLKTLDRKSLYKSADICQMLLCTMDDDSDSQDEAETTKKKDKDKKYQWNHGICPSLKNVRKRRFRKTLKKKYQEQPDIEKEVKRLFKMDNEAIDVKWEEVLEENKPTNPESADKQVLAHGGLGMSAELSLADLQESGSMSALLGKSGDDDLFGELSSSDEEEEDEKDVNIMDSGDDEVAAAAIAQLDAELMSNMSETNMSTDGQEGELQLKLLELGRQLEAVREQRMTQELELSMANDPEAKEQIQLALNSLLDEENQKQNEYEILSSMLNQG